MPDAPVSARVGDPRAPLARSAWATRRDGAGSASAAEPGVAAGASRPHAGLTAEPAPGADTGATAPSPYLPLRHWATPYIEHLIARGVVTDPTPLSRPWREADILGALEAADTARMSAPERRTLDRIVAELTDDIQGPRWRADANLDVSVASTALRDPLELYRGVPTRADEPTRGFVAGGIAFQAAFGPVLAVSHPEFSTRLKHDPDFAGKKDRVIAGRTDEAYLSFQWRCGDVFFGTVDRNWGPPELQGLLISTSPYGYDHLAIGLGTGRLRLEGILTQLDDAPDTTGAMNHRYLMAHRLVIRPSAATTVALWEGNILAGPDRQFEPWYQNILTLGILAEYDSPSKTNSLLGADVATRVGGTGVFGSVLVDDIQIDKATDTLSGNNEPPSLGLTVGVTRALGATAWTAYYTAVTNLTYRTPDPAERVMRQGVGLARNMSDYDQLTLKGSLLAGPGVLLAPEVTLVRQGEGDFRLPYPPVAQYFRTPTIHSGVVQRTVRVALGARLDRGRWGVNGNAGVHFYSNLNHVPGASLTQFVGTLTLSLRLGARGSLR